MTPRLGSWMLLFFVVPGMIAAGPGWFIPIAIILAAVGIYGVTRPR